MSPGGQFRLQLIDFRRHAAGDGNGIAGGLTVMLSSTAGLPFAVNGRIERHGRGLDRRQVTNPNGHTIC